MPGGAGTVAVLGAGAWGTAFAAALAPRRRTVLWARDPAQAAAIAAQRRNERYLPEIDLPEALSVTADLEAALAEAVLTVAATPLAGLRELCARLAARAPVPPLLWLCKGFEPGTGLLAHRVVAEVLGSRHRAGALAGPSFALEVARGLPCALTLAARDARFARAAAAALHGGRMRIYFTTDVVGVGVGGALKNVIAIAVGVCDGLGLGQNARAALVTRGLAEMIRLGRALGARAETLMGLAGAGDLILTATGDLSRNRRVGLELARGRALAEVLARLGHVAEGVHSVREAARIAARCGVDMPICATVRELLEGSTTPAAALERLLAREPKHEWRGLRARRQSRAGATPRRPRSRRRSRG